MKPYYEDDSVTLYHGDCLELADLWTCADVLVTDPPYGLAYRHGRSIAGSTQAERNEAYAKLSADGRARIAGDKTTDARDTALARWGAGPGLVFGHWRAARPPRTVQRLLWIKDGKGPFGVGYSTHCWNTGDEEIYVIGDTLAQFSGKPRVGYYVTREERGILSQSTGHPTPKPVGLMADLIDRCPPGIVADPFAGSGSTLVAAKALGRKAIGVELEERYCEIAARRLSQDVLDFGGVA